MGVVQDCKNNDVVALFPERPWMKDQILLDLLTYWEDLRAGSLAPNRSDIDPRAIKSALDYTFILEASARGGVRFRLAGMQVCDLLGMELRGMPAASLIDPDARDQFANELQRVITEPEIVELKLHMRGFADKVVEANMLLLPLFDREQNMSRILGCVFTRSPHSRPPMRFEISDVKRTRIVSGQKIGSIGGFQEPQSVFERGDSQLKEIRGTGRGSQKGSETKHPHLRLVQGGKDDLQD